MLHVGQQVRTVCDLIDPTGDSPDLFIPKGSVGTVNDYSDLDTPTVDFGEVIVTVTLEEIEPI